MLFADDAISTGGWFGIVGVVVGVFSAAGAFSIAYFNNATRLMKRVDELTTQVFDLQKKAITITEDSADCHRREADLKAEVVRMHARVRALEAAGGGVIPATLSGICIADLNGVIQEFSPALTPILNYLPAEVSGKHIDVLIPPEVLEKARASFSRAAADPKSLDGGKEYLTYALAKGGARVPVGIVLHGWKRGFEGLITATIRQLASAPPDDTKAAGGEGG